MSKSKKPRTKCVDCNVSGYKGIIKIVDCPNGLKDTSLAVFTAIQPYEGVGKGHTQKWGQSETG